MSAALASAQSSPNGAYMSIRKQDANEVVDQAASVYLGWLGRHRWLVPVMFFALIVELEMFCVFAGRGWLLFSTVWLVAVVILASIWWRRSSV